MYRVPPNSLVTLIGVHEAGRWEVYGRRPKRRCFEVMITYLDSDAECWGAAGTGVHLSTVRGLHYENRATYASNAQAATRHSYAPFAPTHAAASVLSALYGVLSGLLGAPRLAAGTSEGSTSSRASAQAR